MIINKLKVLEEHWELMDNNTRLGKRGREGREGGMDGRMEGENRENGESLC